MLTTVQTFLTRRRRLLATALISFAIVSAVDAQAQEGGAGHNVLPARADEEVGRTMLRGRVVYDDTERPVRRAAVMLFTDLNHPAVRRTVTNSRGEFKFGGVKAGAYFVLADAPGALSRSSGFEISDLGLSSEGAEDDPTRVTADGKSPARVELRVRRGAAISGRVSYEDDEPVTGGRIVLYRRKRNLAAPFFTDPVTTDDRGAYRIEGIPPGDYFVGIVERHAGGEKLLPREGAGLAAAYHPAAKSVRGASAVRVEAGGEAGDVNIKLVEEYLPRIAGMVRWRQTGRPAEEATVMLRRKDDPSVEVSFADLFRNITPPGADKTDRMMRDMAVFGLAASNTPYTETDAAGRWSFADVTAGTYVLTVSAHLPAGEAAAAKEAGMSDIERSIAASERPFVHQQRELIVGDKDVSGLTFELTGGARVSGTISVEDGSPAPPARIALEFQGAHPLLNLPYRANSDGSFLLEGVPAGEIRLDIQLPLGGGHYVKAITAGGIDLLRGPLRVGDGAEVGDVRVQLARGRATLSGQVLSGHGGAPVGGAGVLLVPADERMWHVRGARVFGRADAAGAFVVNGPPGDYLAIVWRPGQEPSQPIGEYAGGRAGTALRVRLGTGEDKKLDLHVSETPASPRP